MSLLYSNNFKLSDGEMNNKYADFMDSNTTTSNTLHHHNSGLVRYASAPSNFIDCEDSEMETMLARFMSTCNNGTEGDSSSGYVGGEQRVLAVKQEEETTATTTVGPTANQNGSSSSTMYGRNQDVIDPYAVANSARSGGSLIRQSSSPAGFLSNFNIENGFVTNGTTRGDTNMQLNFSSRHMPIISEEEHRNQNYDMATFPNSSWDGSPFMGLKRARDNSGNVFSSSNNASDQTQIADFTRAGVHNLTHHLSLPKTFSETATMDKFLQFEDSVPCRIRAKRGCATHPRSIAERVRRTRISERMKKLQDLFPDMDKQMSTADMLDLAVEYIKGLQREVKTLEEKKASCTCSSSKRKHGTLMNLSA